MQWDARAAAFAFVGLGLLSAVVQGGLIRRLVPRFGEPRLIVAGIAVVALGFAALALVSNLAELAGALAAGGPGSGACRTVDQRLALANHAPERARGRLRHALLGADAGSDDQLPDRQPAPGRVSAAAPYWFGCVRLRRERPCRGRGSCLTRALASPAKPAQSDAAMAVAAHGDAES